MTTIAVWFLLVVPYRYEMVLPQFPLTVDLASCERIRDSYKAAIRDTHSQTVANNTFTKCIQINTTK